MSSTTAPNWMAEGPPLPASLAESNRRAGRRRLPPADCRYCPMAVTAATAATDSAMEFAVAGSLGGEQQKGGAQALAAGRLQILPDGGDGVDRRHRFHGDLLFPLPQVVLDQVENLARCQSLPQLA